MLLGLAFCVTSCDKDDDSDSSSASAGFVGTWRSDFSTGYQLMTFKANNTGTFLEIDYASTNYSYTFTWNYNPSSQKLRIIDEDGYIEDYLVILLTRDQAIIQYDDGYERLETWYRVEY